VETTSWDGDVPAIVAAWFAGQEQGNAVARVLFGDVDASGRLPVTFPMSDGMTALQTHEQYPGTGGAVYYNEGVFVGYRGYDQFDIEPRFPFGYGLSYAQFAYDHLSIVPDVAGRAGEVVISFDVTNISQRAGVEVAQVYLGLQANAGEPPGRLAGWARLELAAGECKRAMIRLDAGSHERPFSYWDGARGGWTLGAGVVRIEVGASSRDIRLLGMMQIANDA